MSKFIPPPLPNPQDDQELFDAEEMTTEQFKLMSAKLAARWKASKAESYVPTTPEEKEEAFRLGAELFREVKKDLEQYPPAGQGDEHSNL